MGVVRYRWEEMRYLILKKQEADPTDFVEFWAERYNDKYEPTYRKYIGKLLTPESVRALLAWKAMSFTRKSIEAGEYPFVEAVIADLEHFQSIPLNTPAEADKFLTNELKGKGMIWKVFTLHILNPAKYPIFDQHVYRAMVYLKTGKIEEIPPSNEEKQLKYINEYPHFYNEEHKHFEDRKLDKALFSFGQFLKTRWGNRGTENSQCPAITERSKA